MSELMGVTRNRVRWQMVEIKLGLVASLLWLRVAGRELKCTITSDLTIYGQGYLVFLMGVGQISFAHFFNCIFNVGD